MGHIQAEYANTLNKNNKYYIPSWNNDDSDIIKRDDETNNYLAFNVVTDEKPNEAGSYGTNLMFVEQISNDRSSDEEKVTEKDIIKNYSLLHDKCLVVIDNNIKLSQSITNLKLEKHALMRSYLC